MQGKGHIKVVHGKLSWPQQGIDKSHWYLIVYLYLIKRKLFGSTEQKRSAYHFLSS
uniref:Uncharacterized protein n=1 Tax=Arundo donax TaxID=35708 RepID=A0A0A9EQK5_ARUDO